MKLSLNLTFGFLFLGATMLMASCGNSDPIPQSKSSIVDIAIGNSDLSTLVAALTKAELVTVLQGDGPFTVLAPTNAAFAALLSDLGVTSLDALSKEALTPILLKHVISGEFKSTDLTSGYVPSVSNSGPNDQNLDLYITIDNGVTIDSDVKVTTADIMASNGIIHIVDKVILPTDVVDIAVDNNNFTSLVGALGSADGDLVTVLKGDGPFTIFAPVNSAFDDIADVVSTLSTADLAGVLTYHVVSGNVLSTDLTDGMIVTTLNGAFTVNISGSSVTLTDASGATANVLSTDVQGTNGVIHVIDKVLLK